MTQNPPMGGEVKRAGIMEAEAPARPACIVIALASFFLHFAWEMGQIPFYARMSEAPHDAVVWLCTRAAGGDVLIALVALAVPAALGRGLAGLLAFRPRALALYIAAGLAITVGLEFLATEVQQRWQYSARMPTIPVLGTGLLPLLQWLILPPVTVFFARYFALGWAAHKHKGKAD